MAAHAGAVPTSPATPATQLTVEQLAVAVDLPTSTIRMYQTKGLLHPPRRQGRTARYDRSHLDRLRLVQRLQTRGFSLPAIAELIAARERGANVATVLGLTGSAGPDDWIPLRLRDLRKLIPARDLRPRLLRRAGELGMLRWRRGRPHTRRWALESGIRVVNLSVPPDEVLDQLERLRAVTDGIAADFVGVFERRLWPQLAADAAAEDQLNQVRALLLELTETAETVVLGALREAIREAAESFAERHALLPPDGAEPPWASDPVPVLSPEGPDGVTVPEDQVLERFLAGRDEENAEESEKDGR